MKPLELIFGLLRLLIDYALILLSFFLAYHIRLVTDLVPWIDLPITPSEFPPFNEYILISSIASILLLLVFTFSGLYILKRPEPLSKQFAKILSSSLIWLLLIITYYFLIRDFPFSRLALVQTWVLTVLLTYLGRYILQKIQNHLYNKGIAQTRVLIIGGNNNAHLLAKYYFRNPQFKCIGYLDDQDQNLKNIKYLGSIEDLDEIIRKKKIEKIIQAKDHINHGKEKNLLDYCREKHLEFSFIPDMLTMQTRNIDIQTIKGLPIIALMPTPLDGWGRIIKRFFDLFGALAAIIIFSPIMLLIAILIKIDDPKAPILFKYLDDGSRVKRVGQKGKLFNFLKFRTMIPNSHNLRYTELADQNQRQGSPMVKIKNDPRVTKIGKFLRKTSLDELPQLFNVIKGEMSLVGPRPHLPEEVDRYQKHHKFVLTIKPGITGMAQISGRSDLDFEKEVKLDTFYIENWNIWRDIKILFQTVKVFFQKYEE